MGEMTTGQVAELLGTSEPRLQQLIRFKKMPRPKKIRGKRVWVKRDVEAARMALSRNQEGAP